MLFVGLTATYIISFFIPTSKKPDIVSKNATIVPSFESIDYPEKKPDTLLIGDIQKVSHVVKPGDTFYGILSQFDISVDISNQIYSSLKTLGFNSLFPGDSLIFNKKNNDLFDFTDLLSKKQHWYTISIQDSQINAQRRVLKISNYIYLINGTLETSLSEAIQKNGVSDIITWQFVDIFAWDINFFLDPRKGDTFQIIFEQKFAEGLHNSYGNIIAARYVSGDKTFSAFGLKDSVGSIRYYDEYGKSVQKRFLKAPLKYSRISSTYSLKRKHPILGLVRPHLGIDYAAPTGTPVQAAADGKVLFVGRKGDYGNLIILSHGGMYETYYGHLSSFAPKIHFKAQITQGQTIGFVGATGLATGPHLDYRMKHGTLFVNPTTISLPTETHVNTAQQNDFSHIKQFCLNSFDYRFTRIEGLYILEITQPDLMKQAMN